MSDPALEHVHLVASKARKISGDEQWGEVSHLILAALQEARHEAYRASAGQLDGFVDVGPDGAVFLAVNCHGRDPYAIIFRNLPGSVELSYATAFCPDGQVSLTSPEPRGTWTVGEVTRDRVLEAVALFLGERVVGDRSMAAEPA